MDKKKTGEPGEAPAPPVSRGWVHVRSGWSEARSEDPRFWSEKP